MTTYEKKKKAAMIAAAYYTQQEKANAVETTSETRLSNWSRAGIEIAMNKRQVIQMRGRVLRRA